MLKKNVLTILLSVLTLACLSQTVNWLPNGDSYLTLDNGKVIRVDLPSMKRTTLIEADQLTPTGAKQPINVSSSVWSDDNKKVLLGVKTTTQYHKTTGEVWVYDTESKKLTQLGNGLRQNGLMYAKFSPDAKNVAYVYQDKKPNSVVYNLYVEDLKSGKIKQLTFDTKDRIINGTFDWVYAEELYCRDGFRWSPDGKSIAFWNTDASKVRNYLMLNTTDSTYSFVVPVEYPKAGEDPSPVKIGVVDIASAKTKWMNIEGDPRQNYLTRMEWVNSNDLILQQLNRKQNESRIMLVNSKLGSAKKIWSENDKTWVDIEPSWNGGDNTGWNWIEKKKAFVWASEKDGWRHLYRIDINGKESLITKGDFDVMKIYLIDEPNNVVYFSASPTNATQRYLYKTKLDGSSMPERVKADELEGTHNYSFSPNGKWARHSFSSHLYFPASEWLSMPNYLPIDEKKSLASTLKADPNGKQISFFQVTTVDNIVIDGWMVKPKDFDPTKKYPVFFTVYGEPAACTVTDRYGVGNDSQFGGNIADKGYLYVSVENRGAPAPRGREWRKAIYRKIGIINIRDQAMAAKEILKWNFVDTSRVAVHGWSGGGSSTLNLLFQYPEIYKTGIAVAAVGNQLAYDNTYQERYMGLPSENKEDFLAGSPYTHAENLQGKLLYIHGTGDDNVHYANAEVLINALIKNNKLFQMMSYPMRSHGIFEGAGTRVHLANISTHFLLENCPPGGR
ncbi:MAG: DPP IV N-terminal domain-containing protein [Bacteroidetes bacterium]|nr:DPP IV N-terminal domain-containing protein [Bacteroidota bacterium]